YQEISTNNPNTVHALNILINPKKMYMCAFFFFFQAEDGIRDFHVTGVQTCALPILSKPVTIVLTGALACDKSFKYNSFPDVAFRSEERRVGKECRYRWWTNRKKKKKEKEYVCINSR